MVSGVPAPRITVTAPDAVFGDLDGFEAALPSSFSGQASQSDASTGAYASLLLGMYGEHVL